MLKKLVSTYTGKFSDVECPDSLKGLDTNLQNFFNNIIDKAVVIAQFGEDNPDAEDTAFEISMFLVFGMMKDAVTMLQPLDDLCREKNLDLESVFGEKYGDAFDSFDNLI